MAEWKNVQIKSFLKERESRIKPDEANKMGLKRLNKIDFSGEIHLVHKPTNTDMILIKRGDLVISGINVEKGAVAVYQGKEDILATIHYSAYIFDETKIDIAYFKTFLKSKAFRDVINSQIRSGIKTELKASKFLPLEINLPDLETQEEIRNKINSSSGEISELLTINNKNESYISKLRQQILQEAVQGKLVKQDLKDEPASVLLKKIKTEKDKLVKQGKIRKERLLKPISDDEIPYDLPNGWEWVRLGEIVKIFAGNSFDSHDFNDKEGVKAIKITNVGVGEFIETEDYLPVSFLKKYEDFKVCKGDIIISLTRPYISAGLKVCICPESYDLSLLNQRVASIKKTEKINFNYLYLFLRTNYVLNKFKSRFGKAGLQPNLKMGDLIDLEFPLPPLSEQKRIVEQVDKLMTYCDELEKQIKESQENSEMLMESVLKESFQ